MDIEFVESHVEAASRAGILGLAARPGLVWQGDTDSYVASLGAGFERALERAGFKGEVGPELLLRHRVGEPAHGGGAGSGGDPERGCPP